MHRPVARCHHHRFNPNYRLHCAYRLEEFWCQASVLLQRYSIYFCLYESKSNTKFAFFQSSQGVLEVQYNDDTQLSVLPKEQGGGFIFRKCVSEGGIPMRYTINDELPELVRVRLEQIPVVLKHLAQNEALNTPVTSKKANPMRFCR